MKKITFFLVLLFLGFQGFSQSFVETFDDAGVTVPTGLGSWTLPSGTWQILDNGVGSTNWSLSSTSPYPANTAPEAAYINRQNIGAGNTSMDYLVTPLITVPANPQLLFNTRTTLAGFQNTVYEVRAALGSSDPTNLASYTILLGQWNDDVLVSTFDVYEEKVIDLPVFAEPSVYIAFVKVTTQPTGAQTGDRWLVDDVRLIEKCQDADEATLTATATTATSGTITWDGTGNNQWEVHVLLATDTFDPNAGTPIIVSGTPSVTVTSTTQPTATPLTPLTNYIFYVRSICDFSNGEWVGEGTFTTQALPPECGGNFVDEGGSGNNYPNNSNSTITICPDNPGDLVTVTFTSFNTEATWDALYVFDGNSTSSPQIASTNGPGNVPGGLAGGYWGTAIPGPFTSTSADGCLTFWFRSDGIINNPGWMANVTCGPPPACPKPTALVPSAITPTTATLNWTNVGPGTSWEVIAIPCGSPAPTAATVGTPVSTTNYTFTGLNSATCYNFYVRADCTSTSNGMSDWSNPATGTTLIAPPECGGTFVDEGGAGNYPNGANTIWTICPDNPGDIVTVTFTSFNTEANWDALYVFDGNSTSAPQIASTNGAANVPGGLPGGYWGNAIPGPFESSSADGCLTFWFRSDGSVNNPGWVANVTCGPPPTCPKPTALTNDTPTATSVNLSWTPVGSETSWMVYAVPCGSPVPTLATPGGLPASSPTNFAITGLNPITCYNLYVIAICSDTDSSVAAGPKTITTQVAPPVCGGSFVDEGGLANYPNNSNSVVTICPETPGEIVTVTFTSFNTEANWDALYVFDGNSTSAPQIASTNGAANVPGGLPGGFWGNTIPGPFESSSPDGCLTFWFRSDGSVNNPGWVANVTCGPPPTCPKPTAVTVLSSTLTSLTIDWTEVGSATTWQVLVLPAGSPPPNASTIGWQQTSLPPPYTYGGLLPSTEYTVYVRAVCSDDDISSWSFPDSFFTQNPPPILTNTDVYTTEELVVDVLLNSTCASVSNVTSSTGINFGSVNGIGYFNKNGSNFPFEEGVILSSGNVLNAPGPNSTNLSEGTNAWTGDADLEAIILAATGDPMNSRNASKLEFDFIPITPGISFNFIFASEEYGTFQCTFSDAFAFLLTDLTTGTTTNLAVLPSTNTPISVVTIRDQLYNPGCASVNPQYFDEYYLLPEGVNPLGAPIDYNGVTVPLTASSAVVPGNPYHIKLVIADRSDTAYDSAVFLEGGSFDIGNIELGQDFLEADGTALCSGSSFVLDSGLDPDQYTFTWTQGGEVIEGADGATLTVTETGIYGVTAVYNTSTCSASDSVTIEFYAPITPGIPDNLVECNSQGFATFTLSDADADIIGAQNPGDFHVTYFLTEEDATSGTGTPLPNAYTNVVEDQQVVWALLEHNTNGCSAVVPLTLVVQDLAPEFTISGDITMCAGSSDVISVIPGNFDPAAVTYSWTINGGPFDQDTQTITVTEAGTYVVTVNNQGCVGQASAVVTLTPGPVAPDDVMVCGSYTLPALPSAGNYFTQAGGQGNPLFEGDVITSTQTIYVYSPDCPNEDSFTVTIDNLTAFVPVSSAGCTEYLLPDPGAFNTYYTAPGGPSGGGTVLNVGDSVADQTTVYVYADNGVCISESSFEVTIGQIVADVLPDVTVCDSYVLPALSGPSQSYHTGAGCSGTALSAGDVLTSTQTVYVCASLGDCSDGSEFLVTVNQTPVLSPVQDVAACDSYVLPPLSVGSYYSSPGGMDPVTDPALGPGTHTVYVYASTGTVPDCFSEASFTVTVTGTPAADQLQDVSVCQGQGYVLPALSAGNAYFGGPGGTGASYSAGDQVTSTTQLYVLAAAAGNASCFSETTFTVTVAGVPEFAIEGGCQGNAYVLTATPVGGSYDPATALYQWSTVDGQIVSGFSESSVTVSGAGTYTLTVTAQGCQGTGASSPASTSCTIQKGISANGDGTNDFFDLEGFNVRRLQIFNRYGSKVYERSGYVNQWKGQSDKGEELPDGTYYYVIERNDGEPTRTGWIYINRKN